MHFLEQREAELHQRRTRDLRLHDLRVYWLAAINNVDETQDPHLPGLGIDFHLAAGGGAHPEWGGIGCEPGGGIRRHVVRLVDAGADNVAGLHPVFLLEQLGERDIAALGLSDVVGQCLDLGTRILGREPHRMAHVEQRARAQRAHVVGRHIGVARDHPHVLGRDVEHLAHHLRHGRVGALAHVDGAAIERGAAVASDIDVGNRGRGRDHGLHRHREAAAAAHRPSAAVERLRPIEPFGHALERGLVLGVLEDRSSRLWAALAQHIAAAELERINLESARDHVGVTLIRPHQLRDAEAAQRARRRLVGVERVGVDPDVVDVVGARSGEPRFLRHARADVGIGAAVPIHLAFASNDAAVLVDARFDAERRGMLGDGVELLLHAERDLHRTPHDHGQRCRQRFELDVELAAKAAAEIGHPDAHAILGPAQEPRDLGAHERGPLRAAVDGDAALLKVADRGKRLEREVEALLGAERVLENMRGLGEGLVDIAAPQAEVERDIGALAALEMLEVGEGAGGLELLVHQHLVVGGFDLVEHRGQFLIFRDDELHRLLRDMRIGGEHGRHRLADIVHLVDGEDGLVVEGRAVIRLGNDLAHVFRRDHAIDAGERFRRAGIDRLDAAVRHGAAEDLGMQHALQAHRVGIFGSARDLLAGFEPRQRASDLCADRAGRDGCRSHQCAAPFGLTACRIARPT